MKLIRIITTAMIYIILGSLAATPSLASDSEVFKVDPVHSAITFRIKHLGISYVHGRFNNVTGTITFNEKTPESSTAVVSVKASDIDTFNAKRDKDLRSPNFFDVEKYPLISFKSDTFKKVAKDTYEVTGRLSLHGETRPITIKVRHIGSGNDPWGGYRAGFETAFSIKRSDFRMTHLLGGVGDKVELSVNIEGIRQ